MKNKVLYCEPNSSKHQKIKEFFDSKKMSIQIVQTGKDAQLAVHKGPFEYVVIDIALKNNSSFETLTYVRLNSNQTKIIFLKDDNKELNQLWESPKDLYKMGINKVVDKTSHIEKVYEAIQDGSYESQWRSVVPSKENRGEEDVNTSDSEFTSILLEGYISGNIAIFDLYIKLKADKYIKILHEGDSFSQDRIEHYKNDKKIEFLYFKVNDRSKYISFVNTYLESYLKVAPKQDLSKLVKTTHGLISQCVDEVYLNGLNPELVEECKTLAGSVYELFKKDKTIFEYLNQLEKKHPKELGHTFLTAIFASMIVSKIEWAEKLTSELIVQAAIVHDIGKLSLPEGLISMKVSDMSASDLETYKTHPKIGSDMLGKSKVSMQVRQIVKQHHEWVNGEGFPENLTAVNIHPLAKIISFCSDYAQHIEDNECTPKKGLETFILDRDNLARYDQSIIKLFITAFISKKNQKSSPGK